jgi:hypothetical protein
MQCFSFPLPMGSGGQVAVFRASIIHSSCFWGLGSSLVSHEATGNLSYAKVQRDRGRRGKKGHTKEEARTGAWLKW